MGVPAFVLRAIRTFRCAGAMVVLWALFTASEASAETVVRDSPGAVSALSSPAPAGFLLAVVPGAVEDTAQSASEAVAASQPQPSESAVRAPVTDVQTMVAAAPAVLQQVRSAAPASPSAPGWPAGRALGLSGSTAGPAASAQGGAAADLPDTVSALRLGSALVGTTDAREHSNRKSLPGFRPE